MDPSHYARMTADTLNTPACQQIIKFLRGSARNTDLLQPHEWERMNAAADNLAEVLAWQTPPA